METLLVFTQHRDQYHHSRSYGSNNGSFGSPSRDFREISCRTFHSGAGILPTPVNTRSSPSNVQTSLNPHTIPSANPISIKQVDRSVDEFFYSERWAGPAYSTSPPPSSLPIPNFSVNPKRTVSLDLPSISASGIDLLALIAKSAPSSPTSNRQMEFFHSGDDSATKTLRRILNLDMVETD